MVTIDTFKFGTVGVDDSKKIVFDAGLPGFPELKEFALIHDEDKGIPSLMYLQSLEDKDVAITVASPLALTDTYAPAVEDKEVEGIGHECLMTRITRIVEFDIGIGDTDDDAFETLWKILQEKTLKASGNEGFIVGDKKAVCFQEVPLYAIAENLIFEDALEGKNRYSHFGLRFNKIRMFKLGARPVIYGKTEELKRMLEDFQ